MKSNRFFSRVQEDRVAEMISGKVQPNSGAGIFQKGDIKGHGILIDDKTVTKPQKSVTVQKEWFEKISEEAFSQGLHMSAVSFDFGNGTASNHRKYFAMDQNTFTALYTAWKQINLESE